VKIIPCPGCPNDRTYHIVTIREDYLTLQCPDCRREFAIVAGQDDGDERGWA
jgi:hypothetical protein